MKLLFVVACSFFVLASCKGVLNPLDRPEDPGIIAGFVKCQSRNPLSGIRVTLNETGSSVYTNSNGIYSFRDLPSGRYSLTFYDQATSTTVDVNGITVVPGEETRVSDVIFDLGNNIVPGDTIPISVSGTVFDADGDFFEGVTLVFVAQGLEQRTVVSNIEGKFNNLSLERALYSVTMSFANFGDSTFTLDLTDFQGRELEKNLNYVYQKRAGAEFPFDIEVDANVVNVLTAFTMRLSHGSDGAIVRKKFDYYGDGSFDEIFKNFLIQRTYTYRSAGSYNVRVKLYNEFGYYQIATLGMTAR